MDGKEVAASEQGSADGGGKRGARAVDGCGEAMNQSAISEGTAGDNVGQHEDSDSDDESLSSSEDLVDQEGMGTKPPPPPPGPSLRNLQAGLESRGIFQEKACIIRSYFPCGCAYLLFCMTVLCLQ